MPPYYNIKEMCVCVSVCVTSICKYKTSVMRRDGRTEKYVVLHRSGHVDNADRHENKRRRYSTETECLCMYSQFFTKHIKQEKKLRSVECA